MARQPRLIQPRLIHFLPPAQPPTLSTGSGAESKPPSPRPHTATPMMARRKPNSRLVRQERPLAACGHQ